MGLFDKLFAKKQVVEKEIAITSYKDFWDWFESNEKAFYKVVNERGDFEKDFFNHLAPKLGYIKEGIWYLCGMYNNDIAELILTADGDVKTIVFVEELIAAAPQIKGWRFTALKPEMDIDRYTIQMGDTAFSGETLFFYPNELPNYPDEIDISIVHKDYSEENSEQIISGSYIFLDNYLGEIASATVIDNISFVSQKMATKELIAIEKLKSYLIWREKEFVEKYDGVKHDTENDSYSLFEANANQDDYIIATVNTDLLKWDAKASHPWIGIVTLKYADGGMPDEATSALLYTIEEHLMAELKDADGYLNIGHETANGVREIYFACKDFRKPSKVFYSTKKLYSNQISLTSDIYKDKYWRSFDRFMAE
ncbi:DUF695 domain-containing protein [Flavobacterium zepuense]|uniref:DUF695 domain-containing protein n=1 Tax=Flavobacterium zepuense TaxID=2593302 RepID=A0A552V4N2_9FLAO|nr:DUF695 domain-containing protein [Flavobacterium zepuense]TRW25399.1 DUF695 domain-containing protein [Flavobacterium zepuense]